MTYSASKEQPVKRIFLFLIMAGLCFGQSRLDGGRLGVPSMDLLRTAEQVGLPTTGKKGGPVDYRIVDQVICGDAVTAGTMTANALYGTLSIDSTNYVASPAAKLTSIAYANQDYLNCQPRTAMNPNMDLSNVTDIFFRFYIYPGTTDAVDDWRGVDYILLDLKDGSNNSCKYNLYDYSEDSSRIFNFSSGWYESRVNIKDTYSLAAGFDITDVDRYEIYIYRRAVGANELRAMTPVVTFDLLQFLENRETARLIWRFDDAKNQQYNWCGYLSARGMRATLGVITDKVGTTGYLTAAQLTQLQSAGHFICNHCTGYHDSHTDSGTGTYFTDTARLLSEFREAQYWMIENGFGTGSRYYLMPGGKWSHGWEDDFEGEAQFVWLSHVNWSGNNGVVLSGVNSFYLGGAIADTTTLTEANAKILIDKAIAGKGIVCLYWHGDPTDDAKFKSIADYAKTRIDAGLLECVTPYELVNGKKAQTVTPRLVTRQVTIGHPGSTNTRYAFTSAANTDEQVIECSSLIPAFARVQDVVLICTEATTAGITTLVADIGTASGGAELVGSATIFAKDAIIQTDHSTWTKPAISASAQSVFVNATPGANWSGMAAGEWVLLVTYLDYGDMSY
jgi:hypothetical protein